MNNKTRDGVTSGSTNDQGDHGRHTCHAAKRVPIWENVEGTGRRCQPQIKALGAKDGGWRPTRLRQRFDITRGNHAGVRPELDGRLAKETATLKDVLEEAHSSSGSGASAAAFFRP